MFVLIAQPINTHFNQRQSGRFRYLRFTCQTGIIMEQEVTVRLSIFLGVFAIMAMWEMILPRRPLTRPKGERWLTNILLTVINTAMVRFAVPVMATGAAVLAAENGWGLFHHISLPSPVVVVACVVMLDLLIYIQHLVFHRVPLLWRLHRVHHTDLDFDVTTAVRFHPLEIILSLFIKAIAVLALGAPVEAIFIFEILLNATAMFNHGNVHLPRAVDGIIRLLIVTPDMHRVHHSVHATETNSNYGFNLSIWDRIFSTYRAQPVDGHDAMVIGLNEYRKPTDLALPALLIQPFH